MKKVVFYEAIDGSRFDSMEACLTYERSESCCQYMLTRLITERCDEEYCSDAGYGIYTEDTVAKFIIDNFEDIKEIMARSAIDG